MLIIKLRYHPGSSHTGITLIGEYASGQSKAMASGDRLTIYSFTGAFIGTNITGDVSSFFQKLLRIQYKT